MSFPSGVPQHKLSNVYVGMYVYVAHIHQKSTSSRYLQEYLGPYLHLGLIFAIGRRDTHAEHSMCLFKVATRGYIVCSLCRRCGMGRSWSSCEIFYTNSSVQVAAVSCHIPSLGICVAGGVSLQLCIRAICCSFKTYPCG